MKKYQITEKQVQQFNRMLSTLRKIDKGYMTIKQLQKDAGSNYGLEYTEYLEMVYENVKNDAHFASKGIKLIEIKVDNEPGLTIPS